MSRIASASRSVFTQYQIGISLGGALLVLLLTALVFFGLGMLIGRAIRRR